MFAKAQSFRSDEPPPAAASLTEKISRAALLALCASPIALFPVALAVRAIQHYFP